MIEFIPVSTEAGHALRSKAWLRVTIARNDCRACMKQSRLFIPMIFPLAIAFLRYSARLEIMK